MRMTMQQKRWIGALLIWFIGFLAIQQSSVQGSILVANGNVDQMSAHAIRRQQAALMDIANTMELTQIMLQRLTNHSARIKRWDDGRNLLLYGCITGFTGCGTRIYLVSCRIENIYVRSHALIMAYIHCQDGEKAFVSFRKQNT